MMMYGYWVQRWVVACVVAIVLAVAAGVLVWWTSWPFRASGGVGPPAPAPPELHDCHWPDCRDSGACDYYGHRCDDELATVLAVGYMYSPAAGIDFGQLKERFDSEDELDDRWADQLAEMNAELDAHDTVPVEWAVRFNQAWDFDAWEVGQASWRVETLQETRWVGERLAAEDLADAWWARKVAA